MNDDLHGMAVDAAGLVDKLTTGLTASGVDPGAVDRLSQCGDILRDTAKLLGKGQEQTADDEPAAMSQPDRPTLESATADLHRSAMAAGGAY